MGCSLPSFESPSTVVISPPSAMGANSVHDFTVRPFRITVQAPQYVVSQPTCVPVRLRCSRRNSTSNVRGSTSALRTSPFTRARRRIFLTSDIFMPCFHGLAAGAARCDADGALDESSHQHAFVICRTAHVALWVRRRPRSVCGGPNILFLERFAAQRRFRFLCTDGREAHATQNDARILARVVIFESKLHRRARRGIHRSAALERQMRSAAAPQGNLHMHSGDDLVVRKHRRVGIVDERFERDRALPPRTTTHHLTITPPQRPPPIP